jgi:hypothetical protein
MGVETVEVRQDSNGYTVLVKDIRTGRGKRITAAEVMANAGR